MISVILGVELKKKRESDLVDLKIDEFGDILLMF